MIVKENGKEFKIDNPNCKKLEKIRVDGCLITSNIRCDYAVLVDRDFKNLNNVYLIELKGSDVKHGYKQLLETYNFFNSNYQFNKMHLRLVFTKDSKPSLKSPAEKEISKLVAKKEITFNKKSGKLVEQV
ncbi:hypothetical protein [Treponema pedis]|uniref:hypothetical protein n=1 Tax=Treponema pedis TaxID=409322 RepID=UPI003D21E58D